MSLLYSHVPLFFPSTIISLSNALPGIACFDWGPPTAQRQPPENFPQDSDLPLDLSPFGYESYKTALFLPAQKPALISGHPSPLLSQITRLLQNVNSWIWAVPFAFPIASVSPTHKHWKFLPVFQGKRSARTYHGVPGSFKLVGTSCSLRSTNNDSPSVHITKSSWGALRRAHLRVHL